MRLLMFGAGSTIGTLGLPGVKGFGLRLASVMPHWRTELGALRLVVDELPPEYRRTPDDWDLDAAWSHVDWVAKLHRALNRHPFAGSAAAGMHAAVTAVYGSLDLARVIREYDAGSRFTLRDELDRVGKDDAVVSFNWDNLIECVLSHRFTSIGLRLVQAPHALFADSVRFAKPHGSLTWNRHDLSVIDDGNAGPNLNVIATWEEVVDSERSTANRQVEPFLLGAVPIKSELISEVNRPQQELVADQWAALCDALTLADEVCVMGYGFPPEDTHGRYLMRRAVLRRQRRFQRVDLYAGPRMFIPVRNAIVEVLGVSPNDVADRGSLTACP